MCTYFEITRNFRPIGILNHNLYKCRFEITSDNLKRMLELIKTNKNVDNSGALVGGRHGRKTRRRNGLSLSRMR